MSFDDFPSEAELAAESKTPHAVPESPALEDASEDLFDFPPIVAFAEEQRAAPARAETQSVLDPGAHEAPRGDDDLFDGPALERSLDQATHSISHLLAEDGPARETPPRASARHASRHARDLAPSLVPGALLAGGASARPLWVLAAAASLLTIGLFAFLFQTNRAFQATLAEVRTERVQPMIAAPLAQEPAPLELAVPEPAPARTRQLPAPFEAPEETALRLAREELAAGQPADARRRLFELLATIDGVDRARREHVEARAAFLVADTFRAQSRQLAEERR